jgi:hypothetical protein
MAAGRWRWLGFLSSAAFMAATLTYGATTLGLLGPNEPAGSGELRTRLATHMAFQRDGFAYEQVANWSYVTALLSLGMLVLVMARTGGFGDRLSSGLGAGLVLTGCAIAASAQVIYLGAMERLLYSSQFDDVDVVSLTVQIDAVNRVDDYLENLGYVVIGLGLLTLARLLGAGTSWPRGWRILTVALAVGTFVAAGTSFALSGAQDWVLLAVGLLIAPAWTGWLGVLLGRTAPEPSAL